MVFYLCSVSLSESKGLYYADGSSTIFVLGTLKDQHIMLQIQVSDLLSLQLDRFRVLSSERSSDKSSSWSPLLSSKLAPRPLFDYMTTEATLFRRGNTWYVLSLHLLDRYFRLCQTAHFGLDWTCKSIAEIERRWQTPQLITYAGKAHPTLIEAACDGEDDNALQIVVSFVANTVRGTELLFTPEYRDVYTPKFMVIKLKSAFSA